MSLAEAVADVLAGPSGRAVGAFFDFDGTVSDSAPGILASLDHAFNETGFPPPPDLIRFIGPSLSEAGL